MLLTCSGCFTGQGPKAARIRPDTNDGYYPQGEIQFAEHGHLSKGLLVSATPGYDSAFSANWVTMLVPTPPTALDGPVWSGGKASGDEAMAIAGLPIYRKAFYLGLYGNSTRFRFRELAVWILSTDPLIVGLPAGEPKRTWRQFAVAETGVKDAERVSPVPPLIVRFVVPRELDQPLARLALFPADFWEKGAAGDPSRVQLSLVTLPKPLPISDVLDVLTAGDPTRLGTAETVALHEQFESDKENARSRLADRDRLMAR
jgi:hypothetical protein